MTLDCRFNVTKFDGVVQMSMTLDMASEVLDLLNDFNDLEKDPHLFAIRAALHGAVVHRGRSIFQRRIHRSDVTTPSKKKDGAT